MAEEKKLRERNAKSLEKELAWLQAYIKARFQTSYLKKDTDTTETPVIPPPPTLQKGDSLFANLITFCKMGANERLVLILAISPHIKPEILDHFFVQNAKYKRGHSEFGGVKGKFHSGFLPTIETALFLLTGGNLTKRFYCMQMFDENFYFRKQNILDLDENIGNEPTFSTPLRISEEYLSLFTSGKEYRPSFGEKFPASRLTSNLEWKDMILDESVHDGLQEIKSWLMHGNTLLYEMGLNKKVKQGFRSLFHGPPGTGKTLAASLLGKEMGLEVYRIDLSKLVSKYIGETEKNLANVFKQAENKNWILFFDEADSVFGKRTGVSDSKDRYANQGISYLLQKVEDYPGVIILATNLKNNIDEAFFRRFQSVIYFPKPNEELRYQLWETAFSEKFSFENNIDFDHVASQYEVTGGSIINIVRYCSLKAMERNDFTVQYEDLIVAIRKEYAKEGKTI